jgi:hypothetical protein
MNTIRNAARSARRFTVRTVVGGTVVLGVTEWTTHLLTEGRSSAFYHTLADEWVTPVMRRFLDPEGALLRIECSEALYFTHLPSCIILTLPCLIVCLIAYYRL